MNNWFYAHNGEQKGPVSQEELARLTTTGEFLPQKDLVWREGMGDWKMAHEVPDLNLSPAGAGALGSTSNSDPNLPSSPSPTLTPSMVENEDLPDIEPGSLPLAVTDCVSRGFDLTKRYFGIIIAVWAIYIGISMAIGFVFGLGELAFTLGPSLSGGNFNPYEEAEPTVGYYVYQVLTQVITNIISLFFALGLARIGLNLISGKQVEIPMLFKEGSKLIRAILASILYWLIVIGGLLLLIVPGIYWGLKFCHYQTAIVDKDMGVMDSLRYSSTLTQNNKMALLGLSSLCLLINIAGFFAFCIGMIFTIPLTWLIWLVGYRWLQKGPAALQDQGLHRV